MFAQVNFDMATALADKENVGTTLSQKNMMPVGSPARTPLADVNRSTPQSRLGKRQQYTPVTPYSPLCGNSASRLRRTSSRRPAPAPAVATGTPQSTSLMGQGLLNALLYKEAIKVVENATKGLKNKLDNKDEYIQSLERELKESQMENTDPNVQLYSDPYSPTQSPYRCQAASPKSSELMNVELRGSKLQFTPAQQPKGSENTDPELESPNEVDENTDAAVESHAESAEKVDENIDADLETHVESEKVDSETVKEELGVVDANHDTDTLKAEETGGDVNNEDILVSSETVDNVDKDKAIECLDDTKEDNVCVSEKVENECGKLSKRYKQHSGVNSAKLRLSLHVPELIEESCLQDEYADCESPQHSVDQGCSPHPTPRPLKSFSLEEAVDGQNQTERRETKKVLLTSFGGSKSSDEKCELFKSVDVACSPIVNLEGVSEFCFVEQEGVMKGLEEQSVIPVHITCLRLSRTEDFGESESNSSSCASLIDYVDSEKVKEDSEKVKAEAVDVQTQMTPQKLEFNDENCITENKGIGCSPIKIAEIGTCVSPLLVKDCGIGDACIDGAEKGTSCTPVKVIETGTGCSPIKISEVGTCVSPLQVKDCGIGDACVDGAEKGTSYTPVKAIETGTCVTPVSVRDVGVEMTVPEMSAANVGTTPLVLRHCETETDRVILQDMETTYTPIKFSSVAIGCHVATDAKQVGTTPIRTVQCSTMVTPVRAVQSSTMVTPVRMVNTETCYSPVKLQDSSCNTSPKKMQDSQVSTDVSIVAEAGTMVTPVKCKDSAVGTITAVTQDSETSITPVKSQEICTAMTPLKYRQTNLYTMLESLHCEYTRSHDYQARYEESQQRIAELEAQLQCFMGLTGTLKQATEAQQEANNNLQRGFQHVKVLTEKTKTEREEFEIQRSAFVKEREENHELVNAAMEEYAAMKEEYVTFQDRLDHAENTAQQTQEQLIQTKEDLENAEQLNVKLKDEIVQSQNELSIKKNQMNSYHGNMKELRVKYESLQQIYRASQESYRKLEVSSKESSDFLETERASLQEEVMDTLKAKETLDMELARSTAQTQQARLQISELEEELEATKSTAHIHIVALNTEISDSIMAAGGLGEKLTNLQAQLTNSVAKWKENKGMEENPENSQDHQPPSFLASVLSLITDKDTEASKDKSPSPSSNPPASSAFRRLSIINPNLAPISSIVPVRGPVSDAPPLYANEEALSDSQEEVPLNAQIFDLVGIVDDIVTVIQTLQEAVKARTTGLAEKSCELEKEVACQSFEHKRQLSREQHLREQAQADAEECKNIEDKLRKEVVVLREKVQSRDKEYAQLRHMLLDREEKMQGLNEQQIHMKKAEKEVIVLRQKLESKTSELSWMKETMEQAVSKLEQKHGGDSTITENYLLKKEVNSLRMQLMRVKEQAEQLADKANSRTRTYDQNLKKAEHEISVLDNMIDRIRQVILRHKDQTRVWPEMRHLWPELIGTDTTSTPLKPHKVSP